MGYEKSDKETKKTGAINTKNIDALIDDLFPVLGESSITAEDMDITVPFSGSQDTFTPYLTKEDFRNINRLYLQEREENRRLQLKLEDYANQLIEQNSDYKRLVEETNKQISRLEKKLEELSENIKELEKARTREFRLPKSWMLDEEEAEDN